MTYKDLSVELQTALDSKKKAAVARSAAIETSGEVWDAILLDKTSPLDINKLEGYEFEPASVWFDFVAKGKSDEEALKMAEYATL